MLEVRVQILADSYMKSSKQIRGDWKVEWWLPGAWCHGSHRLESRVATYAEERALETETGDGCTTV